MDKQLPTPDEFRQLARLSSELSRVLRSDRELEALERELIARIMDQTCRLLEAHAMAAEYFRRRTQGKGRQP